MATVKKESKKSQEWVKRDAKVISPSYTRDYPAVIVKGRACQVWDADGKQYLDLSAGIATASTGHCHPDVVKAIQKQAGELLHMSGTDFYYPAQIKLAEKLSEIFPGKKKGKVFFSNSGAEANEAGMKLARYKSRRPRYMAFQGAFHGRTYGALSLTNSRAVQRDGFGPLLPMVDHAPYPYCYRCPLNMKYPSCGTACVDYIENEMFRRTVPAGEVAAIIVEPIQGEGGYVVPPPEWFPKLKKLADKYGILLMADEVQSGMGRTGKMFAIEHFGVEPDIITTAKGIASGMPLGATISREDLMTWPPGSHASTFGGNPVSCEASITTIDLLLGSLIENSRKQGEYLLAKLKEMQNEFEVIGEVRGKGLMVGVELVKDRGTKERNAELRDKVLWECFYQGMLILGAGPNTVRFCPPLVITKSEIDKALEIFHKALKKLTK